MSSHRTFNVPVVSIVVLLLAGDVMAQQHIIVAAPLNPPHQRVHFQPWELAVRPSVRPPTIVDLKEETLDIAIWCLDVDTDEPVAGCHSHITNHQAEPNTGYHIHTDVDPRPKGKFSVLEGTTNSDGYWPTTYTADEISGEVRFDTEGTDENGQPAIGFDNKIFVAVEDLQKIIPAPQFFALKPNTSTRHPANDYATQNMIEAFLYVAVEYAATFTAQCSEHPEWDACQPSKRQPRLTITEMNLPWGGLFDVELVGGKHPRPIPDWKTPHKLHRLGNDMDIRLVHPQFLSSLKSIVLASGVHKVDEGYKVVHPDGSITKDGGETHWHLRLGN